MSSSASSAEGDANPTEPAVEDDPIVDSSSSTPDDAMGDATDVDAPAARPARRLGLVASVAAVTLLLDQLSKAWALNNLQDGPTDLILGLKLKLAYNTGAAFSLGGGKGLGPWITVLGLVVVVSLALGYTSRFRLGATAAGLIAGGAIGNLADRAFRGDEGFLHGAVIDFIHLDWWPTFNVADAGIVVGAGLLVLASFLVPGE